MGENVTKEKKGKEKANKAPCPPTVNPVSGKPCGSKTGPICQGYNLRCRKLKDLAACKASCLSDKRCNVAEWTPKSKHCCDSEIATKDKCPGEWSHRGDWTGYTICRGNSEEIKAKKVLGGKQSAKCEKKGKEKKSKEKKGKEKKEKETSSKIEKTKKEKTTKEGKTKELKKKENAEKEARNKREKRSKEARAKELKDKEKKNKERAR